MAWTIAKMSSDEEEEQRFLASISATALAPPPGPISRSNGKLPISSGWAATTTGKQSIRTSTGKLPMASCSTPVTASSCSTLVVRHTLDDDDSDDERADGRPSHFHLMPLDEKKRWLALQANTLPAPSAWSTSGSNVCRSGLDRQSRLVIPHAPPALTDAQQAKVDRLTEPWQRHLQKLLYALKVEPALYQHQFASALLCAGIRGPWPTQDLATAELFNLFSSPYDAANAEQVAARRAAVAPYLPSAEGLEKGCLLGDVMGLGKTVSAVAGLVLREFVAALSGPDPPSGQTSDQPSQRQGE